MSAPSPLEAAAFAFGGPVGMLAGGASYASKVAKPKFSTPSPPNAQPPVTTDSKEVQEAMADAMRRRARSKGYQSTMLRSFLEPASSTGSTEGLKPTFGS